MSLSNLASFSPNAEPVFISRADLARRWSCSKETLKRRERAGVLHPVDLPGERLLRYRLDEVLTIEAAARRD
jgi:hypothetical protein